MLRKYHVGLFSTYHDLVKVGNDVFGKTHVALDANTLTTPGEAAGAITILAFVVNAPPVTNNEEPPTVTSWDTITGG